MFTNEATNARHASQLSRALISGMQDVPECQRCRECWFDPFSVNKEPLRYCPSCPPLSCRKCAGLCLIESPCTESAMDGLPAHEPEDLTDEASNTSSASLEKIERTSQLCPGPGCGWKITKESGCDFIVCA